MCSLPPLFVYSDFNTPFDLDMETKCYEERLKNLEKTKERMIAIFRYQMSAMQKEDELALHGSRARFETSGLKL